LITCAYKKDARIPHTAFVSPPTVAVPPCHRPLLI
jgi:hypothetical protein